MKKDIKNSLIQIEISSQSHTKFVDLCETLSGGNDKYTLSCRKQIYANDSIDNEEWEMPIEDRLVEEIIKRIDGVKLDSNPPDQHYGLDGRGYRIRFRDYFSGHEFYWWMKAPSGWLILEEILNEINSRAGIGNSLFI